MKEKEAYVDCDQHPLVLYVEKDDGSFGEYKTGAYMIKNFLDDFAGKREAIKKAGLAKIDKGEISPVVFYIDVCRMTVADVAARVGLRAGQVKKQMKPAHFKKISPEIAKRYADVFGVSLEDFYHPHSEVLKI